MHFKTDPELVGTGKVQIDFFLTLLQYFWK